mgnify:CR=1 FL=1
MRLDFRQLDEDVKTFLIILAMLTIMAIVTRQLFFILLDVFIISIAVFTYVRKKGSLPLDFLKKGEVSSNVEIKDGILKINGKVKGVLIVDDIPFDYRDESNETLRVKIVQFHKILDAVGSVEITFKKEMIDKNEYLGKLFLKVQNLQVIVEKDPSNARAKRELELTQAMIKKINEGEMPFRYVIYFFVNAKSEEDAKASIQLLRKGLESIGVKSRPARKGEIESIIEDRVATRTEGLPSQVPFLTVFSLPKSPKFELLEDGVYLGKEIGSGKAVFWNYSKMLNPHTLVVGPTGAGKTEYLISLAYKLSTFAEIPVVFFDTKSDIKLRLKRYGVDMKILSPLMYHLSLLKTDGAPLESYISQLEEILASAYQLDRYTSAILFKSIKNAFIKYEKPTWENVIDELEKFDLPLEKKTFLFRILSQVSEFEGDDDKYDLVKAIGKDGVYVVDLSLIRSEELRRLIMLSVLTKIYNRYNLADDKLKIALVVDEAWSILKNVSEDSIIMDLIKRGRGFGIAMLMATQNIEDFGEHSDIYLDNIGLIAFMNNGDKKFWNEVTRFVNINDEEIARQLTFLGRGEALVRFITDPRPVLVSLDSFARS